MKKISKLASLLYLSSLMIVVVMLLLVSLAGDSIAAFFEKKKNAQYAKNRHPKTTRRYTIRHHSNVKANA